MAQAADVRDSNKNCIALLNHLTYILRLAYSDARRMVAGVANQAAMRMTVQRSMTATTASLHATRTMSLRVMSTVRGVTQSMRT